MKKLCHKCQRILPLSEYYSDRRNRDKKQTLCKKCHNLGCLKWQKANPSKLRHNLAKYYKNHKASILKRARDLYKERSTGGKAEIYRARQRKKYYAYPWINTYRHIQQRCENPKSANYKRYGAKGIKKLISIQELKKLWFRDKGWTLKHQSIERKNPKGNYTFRNCEYIEMAENLRRRWHGKRKK